MTLSVTPSPSLNFDDRRGVAAPSYIILHYTGTRTAEEARARFCESSPNDEIGRIAPHYMIDGQAHVYQFVDEEKRAWHAGASAWKGENDLNSLSIGIEIWNTGHEFDFENFFPPQITALIELIRDIRTRWAIPQQNILGHSDIAPGRKIDPGEKFPWHELAEKGIGLMPKIHQPHPVAGADFFVKLARYGYTYTEDPDVLLREFRRHFLPHKVAGKSLDSEDAAALQSLIAQASI